MADSPPGSGIPIIGPILNDLAQLFGATDAIDALAAKTEQVETNVWSNAISMGTWAYSAFGDTFGFASSLLSGLKNFLGHLFKDLIFGHIKGLLDAIWKQLTDKHSWLRRMIATLQQLQRLQRQYQLQTLKKVVNLIQRARQILAVFRLFHLKFAQKLDKLLGSAEGKLITGTFAMARKTNELTFWMNVILDPKALMRSPTLWGSLNRDVSAIAIAAHAIGFAKFFPGLAQLFGPGVGKSTATSTLTTLKSDFATHSGEWGAFDNGARTAYLEFSSEAQ